MKLLSLITNNQVQVLVLMLTGVTVVVKNRSCASVSQLQLWCGETVAEAGILVVFFYGGQVEQAQLQMGFIRPSLPFRFDYPRRKQLRRVTSCF